LIARLISAGVFKGLALQGGVDRGVFNDLLADVVLTYMDEEAVYGSIERMVRDLDSQTLHRDLFAASGLARSANTPDWMQKALGRYITRLKERLELARAIAEPRSRMTPESNRRRRLEKLFLSLFALRDLTDARKSSVKYVPGFLPTVLSAAGIQPPIGKRRVEPWRPEAIYKRFIRAGSVDWARCVAACLFSTEPTLRARVPHHEVQVLRDAKGTQFPSIRLTRQGSSAAGTAMPIYSLESLARPGDSKAPQLNPTPPMKPAPVADRAARSLVRANGLLIFRSLPLA
jgi:hypothetical protein